MSASRHSARLSVEERRSRVATMLLAHRSQREIADALGVHPSTVNRDIKAVRAEWAQRRATAIDTWTAEELAKLDAVERALMSKVLGGDTWAIDRLLGAMHHRARLLGLYAPEQLEVLTPGRIEQEIARLEAELGEHDGAAEAS